MFLCTSRILSSWTCLESQLHVYSTSEMTANACLSLIPSSEPSSLLPPSSSLTPPTCLRFRDFIWVTRLNAPHPIPPQPSEHVVLMAWLNVYLFSQEQEVEAWEWSETKEHTRGVFMAVPSAWGSEGMSRATVYSFRLSASSKCLHIPHWFVWLLLLLGVWIYWKVTASCESCSGEVEQN